MKRGVCKRTANSGFGVFTTYECCSLSCELDADSIISGSLIVVTARAERSMPNCKVIPSLSAKFDVFLFFTTLFEAIATPFHFRFVLLKNQRQHGDRWREDAALLNAHREGHANHRDALQRQLVGFETSITASAVHTCSKEDLLNLNPTLFGSIANEVGSYLAWTAENLEGSKFNSFALQTNENVESFGFSIYSRWEGDEFVSALAQTGQLMHDRERSAWDMPIGIAGFTQFRYVIDTIASAASGVVNTNAVVFQYCKPSGSGTCPGIGNYPSVGEGEISPTKCPKGFRGYSYRECHDGVLGDVKNDKCEYKLPTKIQYENNNMEFVLNTEVSSGIPSYRSIVSRFYMQESTPLPEGLTLNEQTGEITGKPIALLNTTAFIVRAENPAGETYVAITTNVRKGYCMPEGVFERTDVGEVAVYQCALQGSYVGTQKRACVLGKRDGEWQKASGFCMPVLTIVLIVVVVIVLIAVVVFLLLRTRSKKAVGGVKGKAVKTAAAKKTATKTVTV